MEVLTVALDVTELRAAEVVVSCCRKIRSPACRAATISGPVRQQPARPGSSMRCWPCPRRLDAFKGINDAFGKEFGSEPLREVAPRLKAAYRDRAAGRLESDEFLILQTGLKRPDEAELSWRQASECSRR
jgi:hypothetical protein